MTADELRLLVREATAVPTETQAAYRVLWRAHPTDPNAACLTVGFPRSHPDDHHGAFGGRLVWWPNGITELRRVAIVSSRIGSRLDHHRWWFDLLRTAIMRINVKEECVVAVDGTAPDVATIRAAEIFGVPRLKITVTDREVSVDQLVQWLTKRIEDGQMKQKTDNFLDWQAHISPRLHHTNMSTQTDQMRRLPLQDRSTIAASERSYVLACRSGGFIHQLLRDSLNSKSDPFSIFYLANGPGIADDVSLELTTLGAIPWLLAGISARDSFAAGPTTTVPSVAVIANGPLEQPQGWLCHWTRPCTGPWPGQPATEFLDELLLGCKSADRSALATLLQIIAQGVVLASLVREGHRAVSFTEVPLSDFRRRRIYRRHRRRYDFEPWGIAVRRCSLADLGGGRVQYGFRTQQSSKSDSVWFQPAMDQSGQIDWRQEQEWRLTQDLRLQELPETAICLFVDSSLEADMIGAQSEWPVVVVPD